MTTTPPMTGHVRMKKRKQSAREREAVLAIIALVLMATAGLLWWQQVQPPEGGRPANDRAIDVTDIYAYASLTPIGPDGWLAELSGPFTGDAAALKSICTRTYTRLGGGGSQTLTILSPEGMPAVECGAGAP